MSLRLSTACKRLRARLKSQKGVFPPFMFGLLMGVSMFSAITMKVAQQQLIKLEEKRIASQKAQREDLSKALEFAILTETAETYSDDLSLKRALKYAALSSGKTLGKADFQLVERTSKNQFDKDQKRVAIASSDDIFFQNKLQNSANAKDLARFSEKGKKGVTLFDSSAVRFRQVETSRKHMEEMAAGLYRFYGGHLRFPTQSEYQHLVEQLAIKDAWGTDFSYSKVNDAHAIIEFTTPWNYTQDIQLNLE